MPLPLPLAPCPHGSHNPSAFPINPLSPPYTLIPSSHGSSMRPIIHLYTPPEPCLASQASAAALPSLLCLCPFTYRRQIPSPGVICVGHGMGVKIGVHNIAFLQFCSGANFPPSRRMFRTSEMALAICRLSRPLLFLARVQLL